MVRKSLIRSFIMVAAVVLALAWATLGLADPPGVVDASDAWNDHAASYNFRTYPCPSGMTFEEAYSGSDFATDFDAIVTEVSDDLMVTKPPVSGGGELNYTVENWPTS